MCVWTYLTSNFSHFIFFTWRHLKHTCPQHKCIPWSVMYKNRIYLRKHTRKNKCSKRRQITYLFHFQLFVVVVCLFFYEWITCSPSSVFTILIFLSYLFVMEVYFSTIFFFSSKIWDYLNWTEFVKSYLISGDFFWPYKH